MDKPVTRIIVPGDIIKEQLKKEIKVSVTALSYCKPLGWVMLLFNYSSWYKPLRIINAI